MCFKQIPDLRLYSLVIVHLIFHKYRTKRDFVVWHNLKEISAKKTMTDFPFDLNLNLLF